MVTPGTHGTVSFTFPLYSFNVREQQHDRAICWYDQSNNLVLQHLVPRGRVPYTTPGTFKVTYCDLNGRSEVPHGFVLGMPPARPQMLTPFYYFTDEQQSVRFQCAARQRQLLQTFDTQQVKMHDGCVISFGQQLKMWQKPNEAAATFTFLAHMGGVEPRHHYEFDLLWFKQDVKSRGAKELILTFYTRSDERRKSNDGSGKFLSMFHRRPSASLSTSHGASEKRSRRTSSHSRSSSGSSTHRVLPDGDRVVTPHQAYLGWKSLHIEFKNVDGTYNLHRVTRATRPDSSADADQFVAYCHNPGNAPGSTVAHESLWKISHGFEETLHLLEPISGSYTSTRRPSHISSAVPGEESAVYVFANLFIMPQLTIT